MTAKRAVVLVVLLVVSACGGSAETNALVTTTSAAPTTTQAPATTAPTATVAPTTTQEPATTTATTATTTTTAVPVPEGSDALLATWILNPDGHTAAVIEDDGPIPVDVQSVELATVEGVDYVHVLATGIPDYTHLLTDAGAAFLEDRPRADTDFREGHPLADAGDTLDFGQDLGYASTGCRDLPGTGYGFWPPGPACPTRQDWDAWFPIEPVEATEPGATGLGAIGLWVNGVAVFNWGDGQSWANEQTWFNLAPAAEVYDLDVCPGHSALGTYHPHSHPVCLAGQLGDGGSAHSPVYGYAADGVPIAGPWVTDGVLARSSWRLRDYDDPGSPTGCGAAGMRSCLMADQLDPSMGTVATDHPGPDTSDTVRTMSGNELTAVAGYYLEDWYFDAALDDGSPEALDEHNGHLGGLPGFAQSRYHYHVTRAVEPGMPGGLADVFPFYVGPTFWGELHDNALLLGDPGGPGQGGPGEGGPGGPPDLTEAAEALGVTVAELQAALGPPPPDIAGAAATLGVDVEVLRELIGRP